MARILLTLVLGLALLAPGATASAATARPDLVVSQVTHTGGLTVALTTKNRGKRTAAPSRTAVFLSKDVLRSAGDVRLGDRPVRRLKRGRSVKATRSVRVPSVIAAGTYVLLACADDRRKVREASERNNCTIAKAPVIVAPGGVVVGNGGGPGTTLPTGGGFGGTGAGGGTGTGAGGGSGTGGTGGSGTGGAGTGGGSGTGSGSGSTPRALIAVRGAPAEGGTVRTTSPDPSASCTDMACSVNQGGQVQLTASPVGGYRFDGWSGDPGCNGPGLTITVVADVSKSCVGTFLKVVSVSGVAGSGGTVTVQSAPTGACPSSSTTCTLDAGNGAVTFKATPGAKRRFGGWSGSGCVADGTSVTVTNPASNVTCTASFIPVAQTSATSLGNGTVAISAKSPTTVCTTELTCTVDQTANAFAEYVATPVSGYRFARWTGASCTGGTQTPNKIRFTNPSGDKACAAVFNKIIPVTGQAGTGGNVSVLGSQNADANCQGIAPKITCLLDESASAVTFVANSAPDYRFAAWSGCSGASIVVNQSNITISNPQAELTCTASFVPTITLRATASSANGGTISTSNPGACNPDSGASVTCVLDSGSGTVTFTATPATGQFFKGWSACSGGTVNGSQITFTDASASKDCLATFSSSPF